MRRKAQGIKDLLGFTQEEVAQLLRLHRSTVSRFELGKGPIPQDSKLLLGAMLRYIQSPEAKAALPAMLVEQQAKEAEKLQKLMKENEYQYERLSRKLHKAQATYAYNEKATKLLNFLRENAAELPEVSPDLLQVLENRVKASLQKLGKADVLALELQVDILVYQNMLLERKQFQMGVNPNVNKDS